MQPEKAIENQILHYLAHKRIFAWKVKTTATFDTRIGRYRKTDALYMKGVADILGIFRGKPLAIEVKTKKGRLSPEQKVFLERVNQEGGLGFVARSVEEVEYRLNYDKLGEEEE